MTSFLVGASRRGGFPGGDAMVPGTGAVAWGQGVQRVPGHVVRWWWGMSLHALVLGYLRGKRGCGGWVDGRSDCVLTYTMCVAGVGVMQLLQVFSRDWQVRAGCCLLAAYFIPVCVCHNRTLGQPTHCPPAVCTTAPCVHHVDRAVPPAP